MPVSTTVEQLTQNIIRTNNKWKLSANKMTCAAKSFCAILNCNKYVQKRCIAAKNKKSVGHFIISIQHEFFVVRIGDGN